MIPENYKLSVVPNFGAAVAITVEAKPHKLDGGTGALTYGASVVLISDPSNTDTIVSSADQDNNVDGWFDWIGTISVQGAGVVSGTCELRLVDIQDSGLESDEQRGFLLQTVEINASALAHNASFRTDDIR